MVINTSSFVFVGNGFSASAFDERSLEKYLGRIDSQGQLKINDVVGQFNYGSGKFHFSVSPERLGIYSGGPTIIPEELVKAAGFIVSELESVGKTTVSGVGINCDTVFDRQKVGQSGTDFCKALLDETASKKLIAVDPIREPAIRFCFEKKRLGFEVRIEPHRSTGGQNLFTAVNGHQDVTGGERLRDKLNAVNEVKSYVSALHKRISGED